MMLILGLAIIAALTGNSYAEKCCHGVAVLNAGPMWPNVTGTIELRQEGMNGTLTMTGEIKGLQPNSVHGFNIHEHGDLRNNMNPCMSTGKHFNPMKVSHGAPDSTTHHMGDLGNLKANENGVATVNMHFTDMKMWGTHPIVGRALVLHEREDDMGQKEGESKITGNSGRPICCGIIGTIWEE